MQFPIDNLSDTDSTSLKRNNISFAKSDSTSGVNTKVDFFNQKTGYFEIVWGSILSVVVDLSISNAPYKKQNVLILVKTLVGDILQSVEAITDNDGEAIVGFKTDFPDVTDYILEARWESGIKPLVVRKRFSVVGGIS